MKRITWLCLVGPVGLSCLGMLKGKAEGQSSLAQRMAISAGWVRYNTGAASGNCPQAAGISVAVESRTPNAWYVGAGWELMLAGPGACKGTAILVPGSETLEEEAGLELWGAPAINMFAGREVSWAGGIALSLGPAVRLAYADRGFRDGSRGFVPWLGGRATLDGLVGRIGAGVEVGAVRVPVAWTYWEETWKIERLFGRWRPLMQLKLRILPWRGRGERAAAEHRSGLRVGQTVPRRASAVAVASISRG